MAVSQNIKNSVLPLIRYRNLNRLGKLLSRPAAPPSLREMHKEFISSVSHELRTPLTSLSLSVQMVSQMLHSGRLQQLSPEKLKALTETADRQIDRLNQLMTSLLEAALLQAEHLELSCEIVDLNNVVEAELARFRSDPTYGKLTVEVSSEGPAIGVWDRKRIEQALRSLLANAALYGRDLPIQVQISLDPDCVHLQVRDQGIGISYADQRRIFELFERGVPGTHFCGLGIGLYIAHQIALAHGGELRVESRLDHGSTFTLDLPRQPEPVSAP